MSHFQVRSFYWPHNYAITVIKQQWHNHVAHTVNGLFIDENEIKKGELRYLYRQEMNTICAYIQTWIQRQCTCCFKDPKNFDRFNAVVQGLSLSIIEVLQQIANDTKVLKNDQSSSIGSTKANESRKNASDSESKEKDSKEKEKINNCSSKETEKSFQNQMCVQRKTLQRKIGVCGARKIKKKLFAYSLKFFC
ncbi:ubiquitinyl hydrolase 1 [Caerostris darwini]|uniref:Ubiquitinyl hydrolase 1 n=1 Tax=Caerostris darwini TaxID=1538125 RepID=A0AAV4QBX0_9ARAC|nr:ubiquitinyl hydrolase 1 [Caerostris darwini]